MLHCITPADSGGDSMICDAAAVTDYLRTDNPKHFELLCSYPIHFHRVQQKFESLKAGFSRQFSS